LCVTSIAEGTGDAKLYEFGFGNQVLIPSHRKLLRVWPLGSAAKGILGVDEARPVLCVHRMQMGNRLRARTGREKGGPVQSTDKPRRGPSPLAFHFTGSNADAVGVCGGRAWKLESFQPLYTLQGAPHAERRKAENWNASHPDLTAGPANAGARQGGALRATLTTATPPTSKTIAPCAAVRARLRTSATISHPRLSASSLTSARSP
jgi:hypothetical protein